MVYFCAIRQELDCINESGTVLGKIRFNASENKYMFELDHREIELKSDEHLAITKRLVALASGNQTIPMQDDD